MIEVAASKRLQGPIDVVQEEPPLLSSSSNSTQCNALFARTTLPEGNSRNNSS